MRQEQVLLTIFIILFVSALAEAKTVKKTQRKSEGYVVAARYFASDREKFPPPPKKKKKVQKKPRKTKTKPQAQGKVSLRIPQALDQKI